MDRKSILTFLLFTFLGAAMAFGGGILFLSGRAPPIPLKSWKSSVQEVMPLSRALPSVLSRLIEEKASPPFCLPEFLCLPVEEALSEKGPQIAIVIDDMGLLPQASRRVIALPVPISLSYLPYAPDVQAQVNAAKFAGHEILLHLPMEPVGQADPGPEALLSALDEAELVRRIHKNINAFNGYVGINNHMGSKFTSDASLMRLFLKVIDNVKEKGVFFLDSRTSVASVAGQEARNAGFLTAARSVFLDDLLSEEAIWAELLRLEEIAKKDGFSIAIGHPHAQTINALEIWLPQAQEKGFRIVPVRQLVR